jgi:dTDP-L-rhamnose 4-epimerase
MQKKVLITGGAGFIGSHLARELVEAGYSVRALDNLDPQVHGEGAARPKHLSADVELMRGDVRDPTAVKRALEGIDVVYHFAASVGVGQSMYRIHDYTAVNDLGTACVLEEIVSKGIEKLIVASSMSIYGEGLYLDVDGRSCEAPRRSPDAMEDGDWELRDTRGRPLKPCPTPESKPVALESIYAVGKHAQEQSALIIGRAYDIPTVALRFFNVYGPHQALSNPYTGVLAIFASRYLNDRAPVIFEDGEQRRDFVHVQDIAQACRLALESTRGNGMAFNIGSGRSYSVREVAAEMAQVLGCSELEAEITGEYRVGDIRHCFADISAARAVLGYEPTIELDEGLRQMTQWLSTQVPTDNVARARSELKERGLTL